MTNPARLNIWATYSKSGFGTNHIIKSVVMLVLKRKEKKVWLITIRVLHHVEKTKMWNFIRRLPFSIHFQDGSFLLTLQKEKKNMPCSLLDWWMLTGKTLWQAMWLNQLQQAYHTLSVMAQPHTDTLIEIQTESTMTNRLPISSPVCREHFNTFQRVLRDIVGPFESCPLVI